LSAARQQSRLNRNVSGNSNAAKLAVGGGQRLSETKTADIEQISIKRNTKCRDTPRCLPNERSEQTYKLNSILNLPNRLERHSPLWAGARPAPTLSPTAIVLPLVEICSKSSAAKVQSSRLSVFRARRASRSSAWQTVKFEL
jgi:hypothetical protein